MSWWRVIDVSGWTPLQAEQRGLRRKCWVVDTRGDAWLRKSIRGWERTPGGSRPTEPAVEGFTLELARRCGFEVAMGAAAIWTLDGSEVRGFVSRKFHDDTEEQRTGAVLVEDYSRDDPGTRCKATLSAVRNALARIGEARQTDLVSPLVRTLIFDAWIGNGDRHIGNWAILVSAAGARFAPMFDTAGCLGTELQPGHRMLGMAEPAALAKYAKRCTSGFGDGFSRPGIPQVDLLAEIQTWPEFAAALRELLPRIRAVLADDVPTMLDEVSDAWWPAAYREFARRMLVHRATLLEGASP